MSALHNFPLAIKGRCRDYCGSEHCDRVWLSIGAFYQGSGFTEEEAARLVACWNACLGRPDPKLFVESLQQAIGDEQALVAKLREQLSPPTEDAVHCHLGLVRGTGSWVEHRGNVCPVHQLQPVQVKFRSGGEDTSSTAGIFRWQQTGELGDIVAFRLAVAVAP